MPVSVAGLPLVRPVLAFMREYPRIDPAAARRGSVGLQLAEAADQGPLPPITRTTLIGEDVTVDLLQDLLDAWLPDGAAHAVVPGQGVEPGVPRPGIPARLCLEPGAEVIHEPGFAAGISWRVDGFLVPLEQPLRVREAAVLLGVSGRRQHEDLGADRLGPELAALDFGRVVPERRSFHFDHVAHDQPFELGKVLSLQPRA